MPKGEGKVTLYFLGDVQTKKDILSALSGDTIRINVVVQKHRSKL